MKRFLVFLALCGFALAAPSLTLSAQTPEEIITKMEQELKRSDTEGLYMAMEMKIPLVGTIPSRVYSLGKKARAEMEAKDKKTILWMDADNTWTYDLSKNEIVITRRESGKPSDTENNMQLLEGLTEGYKLSLEKETGEAWYLRCTKTASNPDKDAPKRMDLVVSKKTGLPLSFTASVSVMTLTFKDIALGVTEDQVTFDPGKYPDATLIDKRQ